MLFKYFSLQFQIPQQPDCQYNGTIRKFFDSALFYNEPEHSTDKKDEQGKQGNEKNDFCFLWVSSNLLFVPQRGFTHVLQ